MFVVFLMLFNTNCKEKETNKKNEESNMKKNQIQVAKRDFGITADGQKVTSFQLKNTNGIDVNIITYGGIITSIKTPDSKSVLANVVLGFDNLEQYEQPHPYFGALVGRYGNRIGKGKFILNGTEYTLAQNNGENNLHGGVKGFDKVVWRVEEFSEGDKGVLKLSYLSKDMEEGFPGNLMTYVTYTLNPDNSLDVLYEATTDKTTVINLTQHAYFNLSGDFSNTILDHMVEIDADSFVPVDANLIPKGELQSVEGTPFDFRVSKLVGKEIDADNQQIKLGGGYDHCWALNNQENGYRAIAKVVHLNTGRILEVSTTEPGVQLYTGNFLDGTLPAPNGGTYIKHSGLCLETQHYPDSPNISQFPSTTLLPGEKYSSKTSFKFSAK